MGYRWWDWIEHREQKYNQNFKVLQILPFAYSRPGQPLANVAGGYLVPIDGHNRRWIDGSIPILSVDTFGLIFIDVIDPSVKKIFVF